MVRLAVELLVLLYLMSFAYRAGREVGRAEGLQPKPKQSPEIWEQGHP